MTIRSHSRAASSVSVDGERAVIRVTEPQLGTLGGDSLGQSLSRLVDDLGRVNVDLDFEAVAFLSSVGLATVLTLHTKLRAAGGRLALFNVRPHVYEIFAAAKLTVVLDVRQEEAPTGRR